MIQPFLAVNIIIENNLHLWLDVAVTEIVAKIQITSITGRLQLEILFGLSY